ncbi:MAG: endonuclease/exonuclease/phosphatase family protein [Phycisphaeraceae bacterium]
MKTRSFFAAALLLLVFAVHAEVRDGDVADGVVIRVMAYNVEFGRSATPEEIGAALKPYDLDVVTFNEVPADDWTARVGAVLGMEHAYVGEISSANHKDKYRSILSRTPLTDTREHRLTGVGWNPASAVRALTTVRGQTVSIYALHVSGEAPRDVPLADRHAIYLLDEVVTKDDAEHVLVTGDFNDRVGEPTLDYYHEAGYRATWFDLDMDVTSGSEHYTWNALSDGRAGVIDHIFYKSTGNMRATDGGIAIWDKPLSDHHPVWAQILITNSAPQR